jgi:WD40 repeat protein
VLQLPKVASRWLKYAAAGVAKIADGFVVSRTLSAGMVRALERVSTQAWKSAMSPCGQFLALLGDDRLDIAQRSNDFDFGRTKSTVEVDFDPFRGWRKIAWSHDSNLVAIAGSDGGVDIVSANGHRLATILNELPAGPGDIASTTRRRHYVDSLPNAGAKGSVGTLDPVAILLFVDPGVRSGKNGTANEDGETSPTNELLVAGFDGVLRSYAIDALRFVAPPPSPNFDTPPESFVTIFQEGSDDVMGIVKFNHSFSFRPYHSIVTTGLFDRQTNVLTVCGRSATTSKADKPEDDISFWKLTATDARYTKLGGGPAPLATAEKPPPIAGILERINDVVSPRRTILDSSLSPDGKLLATVGSAGELRIWSYATGRCVREYDQDETTFILGGLSEDSLSQRLMVRRVVTEPDEDEDFDDSDSEAADEWSDTDDIDDLVRRRRLARSTSVTSVSSVAGAGRRIVSVAEGQPAAISEDGKFLPTLVSARWWSEQVLVLCFSSGHTVLFDVFGDEGNQALLNLRFPSAPTMVVQPGDTIYVLYQDAPNEGPEDSDLPGLTDIVTAPFQLMTNLILWHWDTEDTLVAPPGHQPRPPRYNFSTIHVTTPEQALQSRIRHGQYVAALDLCLAFELDTDPVFKAQFESQEVRWLI